MRIDKFGNPIHQEQDLIDLIYNNKIDYIDKIAIDDTDSIKEFAKNCELNLKVYQDIDISVSEFDKICQSEWFIPNEYKTMDIEGFLVDRCPKQNYQRLIEELQEYKSRNMLDLLKWLKYIVDTCKANNIIWGVGRGSSVASYVLYLIGVHKIDSLKYNLDWHEFLR